eukprot:TRINITY_DN1405_c0_g1_i1.p2 TRINITY_DN1405_c0_g1~~TRINITY_DN1405_c0_g1_i1.p2  ORF type:complete len:430 (+),score=175.40 TRINITY_DN1405_c0_g1_i1:3089-4378(+)
MKKSTSKITQEGFVRDTVVSWPNVSPLSGRAATQHDIDALISKNRTTNVTMQDASDCSSPYSSFNASPFQPSLEVENNFELRELEEELLSPFEPHYGTPSPVFNFSPASPSIPSSIPPSSHVNSPKMYNFSSIPSQNNIQNINSSTNGSVAYGNNFMPSNPSLLHSPKKSAPSTPKFEANLVNKFGINSTTMPNTLNMADNAFVTTSSHVSPAIADRQKKLEKYRQKRSKRKSSDRDNTKRSQAASTRQRDELGHFIPEKKVESLNATPVSSAPGTPTSSNSIHDVISLLFESKRESYELKTKLAMVFDEMLSLKQKAEEESAAKEEIKKQLENQQKINNMLLQQNRLLWSTVPHNEVFSTIKAGAIPAFNVNAFKEKVDLSKIDLNWTNSPHLEAAKAEENNFTKRWEEMNFLMGAIQPPQQDSASSS